MAAIEFDPAVFRAQIPEFAANPPYTDPMLQGYWDSAVCFVSNENGCGSLQGSCRRRALNLMTAHLAKLATLIAAGKAPVIANSANVGSVSVSLTPPPVRDDSWVWWMSTTAYGQELLALLSVASVSGVYVGGSLDRASFRGAGGFF